MSTLAGLIGTVLVKPALVLGAAAAIAVLLRGSTAAARHAVWAGALIATLALPLLGRVLPPLRVSLPAPIATSDGTPPMPLRQGPTGAGPGQTRPPGLRGLPRSPAAAVPRVGFQTRLTQAVLAVWILGVLLLTVRRVGAELRVRRILRRARQTSDPRLEQLAADLARSAGLRKPVALRVSDEIRSPAVAGVLRPAILLPAELSVETERSPILIHELGHIRRRDCLLNALADVAKIVYWCNPVVGPAVRRMRSESERACDDLVLRQGIEPEGYAHLLLRLAGAARIDGGLPSAAVAMARPRELESRLLAVLDPLVPRRALPRWMPAAFAGLGVIVALPSAAFTLHADAPERVPAMAGEPDRRGDSLSDPASERLAYSPDPREVSRHAAAALAGPDSGLAHLLVAGLGHQPRHPGDLVRERAVWAIAQVRDGGLVEPLLEALTAPDWRVQAYAAWSLAPARDSRATGRLIPLLAHPVWRLRAMAAFALRASGDPQAEDAMNAALSDPAWQVRVEAVEYFSSLGGPALTQRLRPHLRDRHVAVRLAAESALTSR